jgi:hypothetical protein
MSSSNKTLDRSYVLFAIAKKTAQEGASETLGKGSISAVNLMEFDHRLQGAQSYCPFRSRPGVGTGS